MVLEVRDAGGLDQGGSTGDEEELTDERNALPSGAGGWLQENVGGVGGGG